MWKCIVPVKLSSTDRADLKFFVYSGRVRAWKEKKRMTSTGRSSELVPRQSGMLEIGRDRSRCSLT